MVEYDDELMMLFFNLVAESFKSCYMLYSDVRI